MSSPFFSNYLSQIANTPLLTRERETELGRIVQIGLQPDAAEEQRRASQEAQLELVRICRRSSRRREYRLNESRVFWAAHARSPV